MNLKIAVEFLILQKKSIYIEYATGWCCLSSLFCSCYRQASRWFSSRHNWCNLVSSIDWHDAIEAPYRTHNHHWHQTKCSSCSYTNAGCAPHLHIVPAHASAFFATRFAWIVVARFLESPVIINWRHFCWFFDWASATSQQTITITMGSILFVGCWHHLLL